jgi:FAD/FMN-containing dehydrogenase
MVSVQKDVIDSLRSKLRGDVLLPGDPGFQEARTIWNAMIDRRPAMILRCCGVADVMDAVRAARDLEVHPAVRAGGHNIAGNAICEGGLVIDVSPMRSVRVDPQARRAYVEPGATLGDFDREAQAFALATPLGINSTTGVAGLTLGGGFGWLSRKYGLSVDNLVSAEVVSAAGKRLRADTEQNADLFWAIRGGGGNFGIVTLFEFELHPVGPEVLAGLIVFPFDQARSVLQKYRTFVDTMPDDLNVWAVLRKAPPLPFLPEAVHGKEVLVLAVFYAGDVEEGRRAIDPLRSFGQAHGEHVGPMPYTAWQQAFDPLLAPGVRNYWKSHNLAELRDGALDSIVDYAGRLPSPHCEIFVGLLGGRIGRVSTEATAYAQRDAKFVLNVHSRWETPAEDEKCIAWAREFFDATAPYATGGAYVNFMTSDEANRVAAVYGPNYERLARVKKKYDPTNFFRLNQNIAPSA